MTGLETIHLLLEAGKTAYEIATGLKKKKEEDRKNVADLFQHIGHLLHDTYMELSNGNFPHGHCRQIEIFGDEIKSNFKKLLGEAKSEKLGNLLKTANEVERLHSEINSGAVSKTELNKIAESSGEFFAASKLILF